MSRRWLVVVALAACTRPTASTTPARVAPTSSVQLGACADPARDGVISDHPRIEHADRDLDGDGRAEIVVVDRNKCTGDGNCFWNVFAEHPGECARYLGTFAGAALEPLATKGDDNMSDVRAYWRQSGGRMLLESYRFARGGYQPADVILCRQAADDRLECADDRGSGADTEHDPVGF